MTINTLFIITLISQIEDLEAVSDNQYTIYHYTDYTHTLHEEDRLRILTTDDFVLFFESTTTSQVVSKFVGRCVGLTEARGHRDKEGSHVG